MVNLITFTKALLWKKPSISFRLLVSYSYPIQSQLWTFQRRREKSVAEYLRNKASQRQ